MKKVYRWGNISFTGFIFILVLSMFIESFSYSVRGKMMPLMVGGITLFLLAVAIMAELNPWLQRKVDVSLVDYERIEKTFSGKNSLEEQAEGMALAKRVLNELAWPVGAVVLIALVGFYLSAIVITLLFLKVHSQVRWTKSIVITAGLLAVLFFGFEMSMRVEMFRGILFGGIVPSF